jgi:hypothetical protein
MMQLPNSPDAIALYSWMSWYFKLIGDFEPNTDGEIHLEPCNAKDIYFEYVADMQANGMEYLGVTQFSHMWMHCFP